MKILSDTTQVSSSGESLSGSNQEFLIHAFAQSAIYSKKGFQSTDNWLLQEVLPGK